MLRNRFLSGWWTLAVALGAAWPAGAETLTLVAVRDNTLYENAVGSVSNGAGEYFFIGTTGGGALRRGLVRFDVSSLPAGATVTDATLTLHMSRTNPGTHPATVHRLLADWGEGTSDAEFEEGQGAPSTAGDATWIHTFYDTSIWATPGGVFDPNSGPAVAIGEVGFYSWSGARLVADVQAWHADAAANFGWMVRGQEAGATTAKRFDTRENATPEFRPMLVITHTAPAVCRGDANCDGSINFADINPFVAALSGGTPCSAANVDVNGDGAVNFADINPFVALLSAGGGCQ
jgi:hypothetical protein